MCSRRERREQSQLDESSFRLHELAAESGRKPDKTDQLRSLWCELRDQRGFPTKWYANDLKVWRMFAHWDVRCDVKWRPRNWPVHSNCLWNAAVRHLDTLPLVLAQCPSRTPWTLQLSGRATGCATCGLAKKPAAGGQVRLSGPKPHAFGPRQVANSRSCSVQARLRTVRRCQGDECDRQVQQVDMLGTPSMTLPKSSPLMATPDPISSSLP